MLELRQGFSELFVSNLTLPAMLIGALYASLYCFGTLIYLDCRENTFCIPLNRGSSLLAGVVASFILAIFLGQRAPSTAQLAGASLIVACAAGFVTTAPRGSSLGKTSQCVCFFKTAMVQCESDFCRAGHGATTFVSVCV